MEEYITYLIILNLVLIVLFVYHIWTCQCDRVEGLDNIALQEDEEVDPTKSEGVQNIASGYDNKLLIVDNLKVTGQIEVEGDANLKSNLNVANKITSKNNLTQNRLDVGNYAKFGNGVIIDPRPDSQDRIIAYQNGQGNGPYLYYNKQGRLGHWNPGNVWNLDANGYIEGDSLKVRGGQVSFAGSPPVMRGWEYRIGTVNNPYSNSVRNLGYNGDWNMVGTTRNDFTFKIH